MAEAAAPPSEKVWDKDELQSLAIDIAKEDGLNSEHFINTIDCENPDWDPNLQSQYKDLSGPNNKEDSWGLVMIHLPDHPEISLQEAKDPVFALHWMAEEWKEGHASAWTCYRLKY